MKPLFANTKENSTRSAIAASSAATFHRSFQIWMIRLQQSAQCQHLLVKTQMMTAQSRDLELAAHIQHHHVHQRNYRRHLCTRSADGKLSTSRRSAFPRTLCVASCSPSLT